METSCPPAAGNSLKINKMKTQIKYNRTGLTYLAALILIMAGCAVPQSINNIKSVSPEKFRNEAPETVNPGIAGIPWKSFFTNAELGSLIDTALVKNNDLQIAIKDIEAADELYKKAKNGLVPQVGFSAGASLSIPSKNSLNGISADQVLDSRSLNNYTASLGISWEADIWGKVKNKKREALAEYLGTREAKKGIQTILISNIANGYYNLLMLDVQMGIARRNLTLSDSTLTILKLQFASAQVTSLAVQQVEAQRLVAAGLIPKLERQINIQENALSILAGIPPQAIPRKGSLGEFNGIAVGTGLPSEMLSRRPDVKMSEYELQAANARIGIARANMYPSITLSANGGVNALRASDWFNLPASLFGIVGGGLAQPVFQGRQLKTVYNVAKIEREKSVFEFRKSVLNAYGEVSDALIGIEKLQQQQSIAADRVSKLQIATSNADLLFRNGMANYLEVITAQSNVLSSELELASIRRARLNAAIDLYRSLGGGWN
jgi:multidrug efflux system outer membrane protein